MHRVVDKYRMHRVVDIDLTLNKNPVQPSSSLKTHLLSASASVFPAQESSTGKLHLQKKLIDKLIIIYKIIFLNEE